MHFDSPPAKMRIGLRALQSCDKEDAFVVVDATGWRFFITSSISKVTKVHSKSVSMACLSKTHRAASLWADRTAAICDQTTQAQVACSLQQ